MKMDKAFSMISLATRAGKTVSGQEQVISAVRCGRARLVIISEEASSGTRKKISDKCAYYNVPLVILGTRKELGKACGRQERTAAAVTDDGLARAVTDAAKKN